MTQTIVPRIILRQVILAQGPSAHASQKPLIFIRLSNVAKKSLQLHVLKFGDSKTFFRILRQVELGPRPPANASHKWLIFLTDLIFP